MFSHFFIDRPVFAMVISIVIIILGGMSMLSLPVERYPEIAPPTISVSAVYPGANAETVADTVATPIEAELNGVENMIYMSSVCANDGTMSLSVTFKSGTDLDMANVLVQNRVSAAEAKLPQEVQRMGVSVKKKSSNINLFVALYSPDNSYDDLFLANYLNLQIKDELARVAGVGEVSTFGTGEYSMRIWLDPDKLRTRGLTPDDVINAVKEQNRQVSAGQIGEPPAPAGQAFQFTVSVKGRLTDPNEFEDIVILSTDGGGVIRVRDVARVELGADDYGVKANFNGQPSSIIAIYQIPGANAITVADGCKAKLAELKKNFPAGIDYKVAFDNTDVIKASLKEVVITLFMTLALVVLTVYIFLQDFRATIIPSVTIPVSLIGTFAAMSAMGFSINQFTLFGLVLVIGIVVDDAIVVVENVSTHLKDGKHSPRDATKLAMTEITGPIVATTLVLLSVFIPTTFMGGITGTLFKQFAITISIATCFSTLNALTLSPALCGLILRSSKGKKTGRIFQRFNNGLKSTTTVYTTIVRTLLRHAAVGILLFIGLTLGSLFGFTQLPTGFVPQEDEGYCMISIQVPDASSQERTSDFVGKIEKIFKDLPGVEDSLTITGFSILEGAKISSAGFAVLIFKDWDERPPEEHQREILANVNKRMHAIQNGKAFAFPTPSLPGLGLTGGFTMMLQDRGGAGMRTLEQVGNEFVNDGNAQSGLTQMRTTFRANVPQLFVDIDRDQVLTRGLSMNAVFNTLQSFLGSVYINDLTLFNRTFKVKAQANQNYRSEPEDIQRLEIRAPNGGMVPLGAVAEVRNSFGPQTITHYNMYPSIKIMGEAEKGFSSGQAMDILENMAQNKLPPSMGTEWTEMSYQEKTASGSTSILMILAVVLVYLVLAAQYESWSLPLSVCMAVPTALLGAVLAVLLRGMDNNIYTQVGIVLLIGLSTKSAILIVEFAKAKRDEGMSTFDATLEALRARFRAVLMTAFSFILGVIPLLVATGAGCESRKVLGTVVFGGMLIATVISLAIVPFLYYVIQRLTEKRAA